MTVPFQSRYPCGDFKKCIGGEDISNAILKLVRRGTSVVFASARKGYLKTEKSSGLRAPTAYSLYGKIEIAGSADKATPFAVSSP